MPQKTNLNISPYFDDFDKYDNFYKVLFKPGHPIQARELTTLQSVLQNQVESFGSHIFKEGSMVIPGNINYDGQYSAVKLNPDHLGIDISVYGSYLVGKRLRGQTSGIVAIVNKYENVAESKGITDPTVFVKYIRSGTDNEVVPFTDGEVLIVESTFTYGNTTISAEDTVATLIPQNATYVGSAAAIGAGVYFIRGTFVDVAADTILLDPYKNNPSYRVGLTISEEIITSKDDSALYDNAKGFSNYAAPGADRLKISTTLSTKLLTDHNDKTFVELMRIEEGQIKKIQNKSQYSIIKDYFAKRTFEESGDYSVGRYHVGIRESLNDRQSNGGVYLPEQETDQRNTPSKDSMVVGISAGKAYVRGYDIESVSTTNLDVDKPRDKNKVDTANIPFEFGTLIRLNNVNGTPWLQAGSNNTVSLRDTRKVNVNDQPGDEIGQARVYSFNLSDDSYENNATEWDLYVYDIQTYTKLELNDGLSATQAPDTSYFRGVSSGATGYIKGNASGGTSVTLIQTSGTFIPGEQVIINEDTRIKRSTKEVTVWNTSDIKSVFQNAATMSNNTVKQAFIGDVVLHSRKPKGFGVATQIFVNSSNVASSPGHNFLGIKPGTIIRFQEQGQSSETFNKVASVSGDGATMTLAATTTVTNVNRGNIGVGYTGPFTIGDPIVRNKGGLYATLSKDMPVSSVTLANSTLSVAQQITGRSVANITRDMTIPTSAISGISSSFFEPYDAERYAIFYNDDTIEPLTSDQLTLLENGSSVTFDNLSKQNQSANVTVNTTLKKQGITSKQKEYVRSEKIHVTKCVSAATTAISGLTTSFYYGMRVEDKEISLNFPDVVKIVGVFESLDTNAVVLDTLDFPSGLGLQDAAILGEKILGSESGALAQITSKPSNTRIEFVYLNSNKFTVGELVTFEESNIKSIIQVINKGTYQNVTNQYNLDKGQRETYYDYGRLVRKDDSYTPTYRLLAIFDYYKIPPNDVGDAYTVNSYDDERFTNDIPTLPSGIRASNVLDFRPRVPQFSGITSSPFAFQTREFENTGINPSLIVAPGESSFVGYEHYLPRLDRLVLNKQGNFSVIKGNSAINPTLPVNEEEAMDIARIQLPAYLFDVDDATITLVDNRRYTMRDIGQLEDRIENLETVTSLSLLELDTKTLQVRDADGLDRYKSGFFVDDYKDDARIHGGSKVNVDTTANELTNAIDYETFKPELALDPSIDVTTADFSADLALLDSNVRKTGDLVTLDYSEKDWITQPLASRVENVNPFNMIEWVGTIKLTPASDNWVRNIYVDGGERRIFGDFNGTYIDTVKIGSAPDTHIRSRNVKFVSSGLQPYTRYYPFFDGTSGIDVIPKLVEITMSSGSFSVGETVKGYDGSTLLFTARICQPGHKRGNINSPSKSYNQNPYNRSVILGQAYSASSTVLNIDINSLVEEAQGQYNGRITKGMVILGESSGAQASVSDIRLINDNWGDLEGSFFFRDPLASPAPPLRFTTGTKTFKLTNSSTNATPLPGSLLISSGETSYHTSGIVDTYSQTLVIVRIPPPPPRRSDPLAQTFTVDETGAFLTSVDLFFAHKDENEKIQVEVRTVELGTPTAQVVQDFAHVELDPTDINVSSDGTVATKVTFPSPVYLQSDTEYALVILAPSSNLYEAWIAQMGEKTVGTSDLPDDENVIVTKQYIGGSLFKSQNGTIWTANQYQDLKFKLYKAKFVNSGTLTFYNPSIDNTSYTSLTANSVRTYPRKLKISTNNMTGAQAAPIVIGAKFADGVNATDAHGYVENTGGSISALTQSMVGAGYSTGTFIAETYPITGQGADAKINVTFANGALTGTPTIDTAFRGTGYAVGDVIGIKTSSVGRGSGAQVNVDTLHRINTVYLTDVQGTSLANGDIWVNDTAFTPADITGSNALANNTTNVGNIIGVTQYNHGMHAGNNIVKIDGIEPNTIPSTLTAELDINSTATISVASTIGFNLFEGRFATSGYAKVNNEVIFYNAITAGTSGAGTLGISTRGIDGSLQRTHPLNSQISKYELNGINLRRINKTHASTAIINNPKTVDEFYLSIDRAAEDTKRDTGDDLVSFTNENSVGGADIHSTRNLQYSTVEPRMNVITPGESTTISAKIRTVSGTSAGGNEQSFLDKGYESVEIDQLNKLSTPRMLASKVNETSRLTAMPKNKSFTYALDLTSGDSNLSPVVDVDNMAIILGRSRLNNPIGDYPSDGRVNSTSGDPHSGVYVTQRVDLKQQATSLKVLVASCRHSSADFRVLYQLFRSDSSEIDQSFELFPGYDNSLDTDGDGFGDVGISSVRNSGLPDAKVLASDENEFLDYQFTADELDPFTGFRIKVVMSGTNEAQPPRFKDLRVIALA